MTLGSHWGHFEVNWIACAIDVLFRGARKRVPSTLTLSFDWPRNETRSFIAYSIFDLIWIRVATLMDATKGWCVEHSNPQSSETSKPSLETSKPNPETSKPSPEMAAASAAADTLIDLSSQKSDFDQASKPLQKLASES